MSFLSYFILDYGIHEDSSKVKTEPTLGKKSQKLSKDENIQRNRNRQRLKYTLFLYFSVALGVLAYFIFGDFLKSSDSTQISFNIIKVSLSFIVAAIIFPSVYRSAGLNRRRKHPVQFFLAFQNGFFWQALLTIIAKTF